MKLLKTNVFSLSKKNEQKNSVLYNFIDNWKTLYEKSKNNKQQRIIYTVDNPITNSDSLSSYTILHNEDRTTDIEFVYQNGKKIKLINCGVIDTYCDCNKSDHNHETDNNLCIQFYYESIL